MTKSLTFVNGSESHSHRSVRFAQSQEGERKAKGGGVSPPKSALPHLNTVTLSAAARFMEIKKNPFDTGRRN